MSRTCFVKRRGSFTNFNFYLFGKRITKHRFMKIICNFSWSTCLTQIVLIRTCNESKLVDILFNLCLHYLERSFVGSF